MPSRDAGTARPYADFAAAVQAPKLLLDGLPQACYNVAVDEVSFWVPNEEGEDV